jgi:hypothetical protein
MNFPGIHGDPSELICDVARAAAESEPRTRTGYTGKSEANLGHQQHHQVEKSSWRMILVALDAALNGSQHLIREHSSHLLSTLASFRCLFREVKLVSIHDVAASARIGQKLPCHHIRRDVICWPWHLTVTHGSTQ